MSVLMLTDIEIGLKNKFISLKARSGSHSPSVFQILNLFGRTDKFVDACFLSNPYATDLFFKYLESDLISNRSKLREKLEYYPSQNNEISSKLSKHLGVDKSRIFIGNGATEIIQAVLINFVNRVVVNIPTFSPYYEFINEPSSVVFYQMNQNEDFHLNIEEYLRFVNDSKADSIVLINPNNPDGSLINKADLRKIVERNKHLKTIIIDESFIHFSSDPGEKFDSFANESIEFSNVIIIKSISKDFGIAGVRAGYAIMSDSRVSMLTSNGYLWNSNGLAEYFFDLLSNDEFLREYEVVRNKYNILRTSFINSLRQIKGIRVYPSKANFVLIELTNGTSSLDFVIAMLNRFGIYLRVGNDKIGLNGEFIRIAIRDMTTNEFILKALGEIYDD